MVLEIIPELAQALKTTQLLGGKLITQLNSLVKRGRAADIFKPGFKRRKTASEKALIIVEDQAKLDEVKLLKE